MADLALIRRLRLAVSQIGEGRQKDAAREARIAEPQLSNYLRGVHRPSEPVLRRLAEAAGVRAEWLIHGEGHPWSAESPAVEAPATAPRLSIRDIARLAEALGVSPAGADRGSAKTGDRQDRRARRIVKAEEYRNLRPNIKGEFVAITGRAAAGVSSLTPAQGFSCEAATEYIRFPGAVPRNFAVRIDGASMEPDFPNGSIVLVGGEFQPHDDPRPALVFYKDAAGNARHAVKVVSRDEETGDYVLAPLNTEMFTEERVPGKRFGGAYAVITGLA